MSHCNLVSVLAPDFNSKLQAMGFELSDEGSSTYTFNKDQGPSTSAGGSTQRQATSADKKPSSIYRLVSKKCADQQKPVVKQSSSSLKKVQFEEHNTSTESDSTNGQPDAQYSTETDTDLMDETEDDFDEHTDETHSETQESFDDTYDSGSESSIPESYKSPSKRHVDKTPTDTFVPMTHLPEEDDVSMSAFVPASVRRQSVLPSHNVDSSEDSYSGAGAQPEYTSTDEQTRKKLRLDDTDSDEEGDRAEMDNLLDEAMDDLDEVNMRKDPKPQPVCICSSISVVSEVLKLVTYTVEATVKFR